MNISDPVSLKQLAKTNYTSLMERRIRKILMICSSYDAYILEEDGQIEAQLYKEYIELNLSNPPSFTWVNTSQDALSLLKINSDFDLIICMLNIRDFDLFSYSRLLKEAGNGIPIVMLTNFSKELFKQINKADRSSIDYIFCWHGNADLILAIVKLIEDKMNADDDILKSGVRAILLVEDSIRYYSTYLPAIYKMILKQSAEFLKEAFNEQQMKMRKRARPKILLATCYDDALNLYEKYKKNLMGVISDVGFVMHKSDPSEDEVLDAGIRFTEMIRADIPQMPVILQSSQKSVSEVARKMKVGFIEKYSNSLLLQLGNYITEEFGFGDFIVRDLKSHSIIGRAKNLKELQGLVMEMPEEELLYYCAQNRLSKWLYSRGLFSIARQMRIMNADEFNSTESIRDYIVQQIKDYRILTGQGIIASFDPDTYTRYIWFAKLGDGSLGGKARGLAFLNNMIQKYDLLNRYPGLKVTIPRSIVIATDYFDSFILENGLQYVIDADVDDDEILSEFVSSRLPEHLIEQLRVYVETVSFPLAVRSSSKLEDSQFQPFAGIYSTYMIPNTENKDQMLRLLGKAIKSVYASVYFASSRSYIRTTGNLPGEEKMAVVIQGICGSEDCGFYFPTISGVARSVNFYPVGDEKPEDGIVNMAFGLGKLVVDGGKTLRFSPKYPKKVLQTSTPRIALNDCQNSMYALDLKPEEFKTSIDDGINIRDISITDAEKFRNLRYVASTWDMDNQRIAPGVHIKGMRLISFDNILQYDSLPVPQVISDLLYICKEELRCQVEIEFAVNMDVPQGKPAQFSILQVRPVTEFFYNRKFKWDLIDMSHVLISSENALGAGYIEGVTDIVIVREENFDRLKTGEIAAEIGELNRSMVGKGRSFILVGPGRWGSSDKSLGIPVTWDKISEVKVIVECEIGRAHV